MLPLNSHPAIISLLIDDYVKHDQCRRAEWVLHLHFSGYNASDEIYQMARKMEDTMSVLIDDCILLIAANAPRSSVTAMIKSSIGANELQAYRIFAVAEYKWASQFGH